MAIKQISDASRLDVVLNKPWHLFGIFFCAFVLLVITMNMLITYYDEGLILFGAVRILSGDVPYRDFYANYGLAQFYIVAALFKIFGVSVIVERSWDLLIRSSTVLMIYMIISYAWSRKTALFTAFAAVIWLTGFGVYGYPVFPCLFFSLLSLYFALPVFRRWQEIKFSLASGACIGVVLLFRYDIGILAAAGGLLTFGCFYFTQEDDARLKMKTFLRSMVTYVCGIVLVSVPVLLLLLSKVSLHEILRNLVYLQASTYVHFRSLPFPSLADVGEAPPLLTVYLPILGVLMGAIMIFLSRRQKLGTDTEDRQEGILRRQWILIQLCVLSVLFFLKGFIRVDMIHMSLSIVPAVMLLCVIVEQWRQIRYRTAMVLLWLAFACFMFVSLIPIGLAGIRFANNVAWAKSNISAPDGVGSCNLRCGMERMRCFTLNQNWYDAINYIQQRTKKNEYIYVGTKRHDKIVQNDILFYFAACRLSATKWHQFDPGIQTTKDIQSEIISELRIRHPRYIMLNSEWDNVHEPNESALSSGVTLLDDFLKANYRVVATFGSMEISELATNLTP